MKARFSLSLLFTLGVLTSFAQSLCSSSELINVTVDTFDSGSRNDIAYAVAFIVIIDENGNDYRDETGGTGNDAFNSVIQASDGRIIVCGWKKSTAKGSPSNVNVWVVEYDLEANLIEEHEYGGSGTDQGWTILEDGDNDAFVIAGRAGYADPPDGDLDNHNSINAQSQYWVFRIDYDTYSITAFNRIYRGNFTGEISEDWATSINIDSDGNYMVSGYCASCDPNEVQWDALLLNLDPSDGSINWGGVYGYNPTSGSREKGTFEIREVREFGTDYFVAAGNHHASETGSCFGDDLHDAYVVKIDDTGDDIWSPGCELQEGQDYGGTYTDDAYAIVPTCDKEYLFAGRTKSPGGDYDVTCKNGTTTSDAWLVKVNRNGTIDWDASLGEEDNDAFQSIEQNEEGSYIAAGEFGGEDYGQGQDFYVVWFEIEECTTRLVYPASNSYQGVTVNPNPSEGFFEVSFEPLSGSTEPVILEILDQAGQVVFIRTANLTEEYLEEKIDATLLPAGFYLLRILSGNESRFVKVIIQ